MKKIRSQTYSSSILSLKKNEAIILRRHRYQEEKMVLDIHSKFWSLGYGDFPENSLYFWSNKKWNEVKGQILLYLSPFSIIKWKIRKGNLKWIYLLSQTNLEKATQIESKIISPFQSHFLPLIKSSSSLLAFIEKQHGIHPNLKSESHVEGLLRKTIQKRFMISENIKSLVKENYNYSYVSRQFKKSYDISPVKYRNQLRLIQASHELLFSDESILEIANKIGLTDSKFFYNQFKTILGTNPSKFLIHKKKFTKPA
ncbi:MAG: AraC family transcriptional regulator [Deltaproteobacteria bacterium]|jgi:hypothetical protein|nr:AraC family transcriptional regulator [Deltaproteobacteria bacterium]